MIDPVPVVVDIADEVEVVLLPAALVSRARAALPEGDHPRLLRAIALLVRGLGERRALPAVEEWLVAGPATLRSLPEAVDAALGDAGA